MNHLALLLDYSFQAVVKNWRALVLYALFLIILTLLYVVHPISVIANFLLQLMTIQVMVYYGSPLLKEVSKEELYSFLESSTVKKVFTERFEVSAGIFLASFLTNLILTLVIVLVVFLSGIPFVHSLEGISSPETASILLKLFALFLFILLIVSWYVYVYPLALGYAMGKEGFGEAFLGFFKIFAPSLWKRALSFKYFVFITVTGILGAIFLLIGALLLITVIFFPLGAVFLYFSNVFFGGAAARSYFITSIDESQSRS